MTLSMFIFVFITCRLALSGSLATGPTPTVPVTGQTQTAAPRPPCETQKRWSMWIDSHTPESAGGDSESMTAAELSRFCQRGIVDSIECQTFDGMDFKIAGDIVSCDVQKGLVCEEYLNYPVGCQDYRVRYQCTEEICQTQPELLPGQLPTAQPGLVPSQSTTAQQGLLSGQSPTAKPGLLPGQSPISQPELLPGQSPTAQPGALDSKEASCNFTCVLLIGFGVGLAICIPAIIGIVVCYKKSAAKKRISLC